MIFERIVKKNCYNAYKENENINDHEEIGDHNAEKIQACLLVKEIENILNNFVDLPSPGYTYCDEISVYEPSPHQFVNTEANDLLPGEWTQITKPSE